MYRYILTLFAAILLGVSFSSAQVPTTTLIKIVKAEDARRYDEVLESLINSPDLAVRDRAALAAGRIGDDRAIPALVELLETEAAIKTAAMAAFAIGEIESGNGADAILKALNDPATPNEVRARAVEAAGKIAAANAKDPKSKELGKAIISTLESEYAKAAKFDRETVLLGLTALLRVRPEGADVTAAHFLTNPDARVRADAGNTMTRIKAKNANRTLRKMLATDTDPIARANAARALGAAEDKDALELLLKAATTDTDSRVRVSAIRAIGSLKDEKAADRLLKYGEMLLQHMRTDPSVLPETKVVKPFRNSVEKNELLEISVVIGRLMAQSHNPSAMKFLTDFASFPRMNSETEVCKARINPSAYALDAKYDFSIKILIESSAWFDGRDLAFIAQGLGEVASSDNHDAIEEAINSIQFLLNRLENEPRLRLTKYAKEVLIAIPDILRSCSALKCKDLNVILNRYLKNHDVFVRAATAELMANQPSSKAVVEALKVAFDKALVTDKHDDDAQLAILDALYKLDKKESVGTLLVALSAPDYLVRKKAFDLLSDKELQRDFPGIPTSLENARAKHKDQVLPYSPAFGTKLGQVLNTDADYRRAVMRKNGSVKAVLTTEKGTFTIVFNPEEAPLTVDNFIKLARLGYFNGLEVHRVVPNFVMQDGDPRGDGNGGPGWSIRCEINMLPYDRGAVGMALSGKDTGGSQWFVTHSPQPHLDGGYTVFGHVNETDMKVVDSIVRGDKIISVKIVEGKLTQRPQNTPRKKH